MWNTDFSPKVVPQQIREGPRGVLRPETGRGERSAGWILTQPEYQIFIKMTPKEWLNMKSSQILPKESGSKRKKWYPTGVCLTFEYPIREYTWGEKGCQKGGTSLLTLTEGVHPPPPPPGEGPRFQFVTQKACTYPVKKPAPEITTLVDKRCNTQTGNS